MASNHKLSPLCVGSTPTSNNTEVTFPKMILAVKWDLNL